MTGRMLSTIRVGFFKAGRSMRQGWLFAGVSALALVLAWLLLPREDGQADVDHSDAAAPGALLRVEVPEDACRVDGPSDLEVDTRVERALPDASVVIASRNHNPPRYPRDAIRDGVHGTTIIEVVVAADARVAHVGVVTSSGDGRLDRAALEAARRWTYLPARRDDEPLCGRVLIPVHFMPA